MSRSANDQRPWARKDGPLEPIAFDLTAMLDKVMREAQELVGLLRDVGEEVQFCLRRRHRLDPEFLSEFTEILDWYVVFHTVGLVDRRGVWLGPSS